MKTERETDDGATPEAQVDPNRTGFFLRLALSEARPVDDLLERLSLPDGNEWLGRLTEEGPAARLGAQRWIGGTTSNLEDLRLLKEQAKDLFRGPRTEDERLSGILCYFLSLASAVVRHRVWITDQSRADVVLMFRELSSMLPSPWSEVFDQASKG